MKTVRVWVPCPTWEEVPVTTYERVCESRPVTCRVTVYHQEVRPQSYQVTSWKCVPEQHTENYTCMVSRQVPYQATRTVAVCVPYQETVTLTRMVPRVVEQAPAAGCGDTGCCEVSCCKMDCCQSHAKRCHWRGFRRGGCCD
jgi:hypothetical protein